METRLPVIVGFGGFGPAGRSSNHNAYRRMVFESLSIEQQQKTVLSLAILMKLVTVKNGTYFDQQGSALSPREVDKIFRTDVLNGTLIRRIENTHFDPDAVPTHQYISLSPINTQPVSFQIKRIQLPEPLPLGWIVENNEENEDCVNITLVDSTDLKIESVRKMPVTSAGQLPTGFNPGSYYRSNSHPRGLSMALLGASDALRSMGIEWADVMKKVKPDEVSVYSGSLMCQVDKNGYAGFMQSSLLGSRVTSKQLPLSLNSMPADFINAYVLGSVGSTGSTTGTCATFLYNLRAGITDIKTGKSRVVLVGNSEAPLQPEVFDGYHAMSALASDEKLRKLDNSEQVNHRQASRPFGENCGFTLAESSQYFVLMDDELAMELGAEILGAVTDVFVNSDGHKKSISAPGPGNYITLAKAVASVKSLLGEDSIKSRSFVQAHGSSTPKNRTSEADALQRVATSFDIHEWPILAIKSYIGHSLSPAGADQLMSTLGVFHDGILPGIKTTKAVAEDVQADRLFFPLQDKVLEQNSIDVAFLNSKGFGGNNATACILSPNTVEAMLKKRFGETLFAHYQEKRRNVRKNIACYEDAAMLGQISPIYKFGKNMIDESKIVITKENIFLPGFSQTVNLSIPSPYADMIE